MNTQEELKTLVINGIEVLPSGRSLYLVHHAGTERDLGSIRRREDHRWEAVTPHGRLAGVHRTLEDAVDSLSLAAATDRRTPAGNAVEYLTEPGSSRT
jgi:hypothetical protein